MKTLLQWFHQQPYAAQIVMMVTIALAFAMVGLFLFGAPGGGKRTAHFLVPMLPFVTAWFGIDE